MADNTIEEQYRMETVARNKVLNQIVNYDDVIYAFKCDKGTVINLYQKNIADIKQVVNDPMYLFFKTTRLG